MEPMKCNPMLRLLPGLLFLAHLLPACPDEGASIHPPSATPEGEGVVSISPSVTEIVAAISGVGALEGVTNFCNHPPGVERLTRVGGWINPNIEKIVSLSPGLVIGVESQGMTLRRLRDLGIETLMVKSITLEDILDSYLEIGRGIGNRKGGERLRERVGKGLERMRSMAGGKGEKKRALLIVGRNPASLKNLYVAARPGYLSELLEIAGGENIVDAVSSPFINISIEFVRRENPDLIIEFTSYSKEEETFDPLAPYRLLKGVRAVEDERIHLIGDDFPLIPGTRLLETLELLHSLLMDR